MSRTQILIFSGLGIAMLVLVLVIFSVGRKPPAPQPATLEFWGIGDDESVWSEVLTKFKENFPHITVNYRRLDLAGYEETLLNRLAEGKGPDIFLLKNSWTTKHRDKIFPLPQSYLKFSPSDFKKLFVDGAYDDLVEEGGQILGLPLFLDTPVLFYNKDTFNSAGIALAPQTWEDTLNLSQKLTASAPSGDIIKSGLALGSTKNVEHWFEIINSLIFQQGDRIINPQTKNTMLGLASVKALTFFSSFASGSSANFSWTSRRQNSLDDFAEGQTAMVIGLSGDIRRIQAKNPHMNFGIAPFPQTADAKSAILYGTYFFPTVSKFTKNPGQAWQFIYFLTAQDGAKIYLEKTRRPAARRDLIAAGGPAGLETFYKQSLIARSWPIPDENATLRIFGDAVESIITRATTPEQATARIEEQLKLLLR